MARLDWDKARRSGASARIAAPLRRMATSRQLGYLRGLAGHHRVALPSSITAADAHDLINELKHGPPAHVARRLGVRPR